MKVAQNAKKKKKKKKKKKIWPKGLEGNFYGKFDLTNFQEKILMADLT